MRSGKSMILVAALLGWSAPAAAQPVDIGLGREVARTVCNRCHDVEPGGAFKEYPPSFASIAVYRSEEQIRGRIIFPPLHANMPNVAAILSPEQLDTIVAYIMSLEKQ